MLLIELIIRESTDDDDVIELFYTVEIPLVATNRHPFCPYKYCVFSNVTKQVMNSPFEFIPGHALPKEIINRSLKFIDSSYLNKGSKYASNRKDFITDRMFFCNPVL